MVDPGVLANDVLGTVAELALPPVAWLVLFLIAWEDPAVARASGFDRRVVALLLPVGLLAELGTLPFFGWDGNILAINLAGGAVPLLLSGLLLRRNLGRGSGALGPYLAALAAETAAVFGIVVLVPNATLAALGALAVLTAAPLLLALRAPRPGVVLGITSAGIFLTYLTTTAVPGVGIISVFPFYLLAPVLIGLLAAPVVRAFGDLRATALPLAYATATFGTLVGADVLRQPPLYGSGPTGLLSIGGAGLLDLVYLSGLFALTVAYAVLWLTRPSGTARASAPDDPEMTPSARLREALDLGYAGRPGASVRASVRAADAALARARELGDVPPVPGGYLWQGLGVPPWFEADHQNLRALARTPSVRSDEAARAWTTSRVLVLLGQEVARRRVAPMGRRVLALALDLAVTLGPAIAIFLLVAATTAPSGILDSSLFNAVALGYAAYAVVYLALAEALTGTTVGKHALGLEVTDRHRNRPGPVAALVRNLPLVLPLLLFGLGAAIGVAALFGASVLPPGDVTAAEAPFLQLELAGLVAVLALVGLVALFLGWLAATVSPDGQRVGDYLAGTWVVRRRPAPLPPPRSG